MADNVAVTEGTGKTIASDEVAGVNYQQIKLVDGAADSTTPTGVTANPLQVALPSATVTTLTPPSIATLATSAKQLADGHSVALSATDNAVLDAAVVDLDTIAGDTTSIDGKTPSLGQALAAASIPVILPTATISTLTPPAAISGFATSAKQLPDGHAVALSATDNAVLDTIDTALDAINAKLVTGTDIGDVTINNAAGAAAVNIQDGGNAITVDGSVTAVSATAANLKTAATLDAETTKVIGTVNVAAAQTIATTNAGTFATQATLQTGSAAIGKLAANSGVDIGDVDVTSIAAGTNKIGDVDIAPRTTGGWSVGNFTSGDTYTALTNSAQVLKASAGKFGGYYIYNPNAAVAYVLVYNIAAAGVTVGTSTAKLVFAIPAGAAANIELIAGIPFDTAMSIATTTTGGGVTAPTTALEAMIYYV